MRGSWNRVTTPPYSALEFATNSIRAAEGVFRILHIEYPHPRRSISVIAERMRDILENQSVSPILSAGPSPPAAPCIWMQEVVKLRAAMFKNFVDPGRDRVVLSNFLKWASEPMPARQAGVNFNNRYYEICHENRPLGSWYAQERASRPFEIATRPCLTTSRTTYRDPLCGVCELSLRRLFRNRWSARNVPRVHVFSRRRS